MLIKKVKNNTGSTKTYVGTEIAPAAYYQIQPEEERQWIESAALVADITAGDVILNNGTVDLNLTSSLVWLSAIDPACVETELLDLIPGASNPPHQEGRFFYDPIEKAYSQYNDNPNITHQLGQEFLIRVYNNSGVSISDGKPVYVTGTEGVENRPTVALAKADATITSKVIGVCTATITDGTFGWITHIGLVNGIDTTAFASGDDLYLDESTAGEYRNTPPPAGNELVHMGYVIRVHATEGRLLIAVGDHFDHFGKTDNPHAVTKAQVGLSEVPNLKVKLDATVAPIATDDNTAGYSEGSVWVDVVENKSYTCVDSSTGASIWSEGGGGEDANIDGGNASTVYTVLNIDGGGA